MNNFQIGDKVEVNIHLQTSKRYCGYIIEIKDDQYLVEHILKNNEKWTPLNEKWFPLKAIRKMRSE